MVFMIQVWKLKYHFNSQCIASATVLGKKIKGEQTE